MRICYQGFRRCNSKRKRNLPYTKISATESLRVTMTIVASYGVSVVAFKQSGILERRDVTEDLILYMMIKI